MIVSGYGCAMTPKLLCLFAMSALCIPTLAQEINSCRYLAIGDFANDPYGIAAELRAQAGAHGFQVVSSIQDVPDQDRLSACAMGGNWSSEGAHGHVAVQVKDITGSLVAEAFASGTAWVSASRTVRAVVSKIYSQLGYSGFDQAMLNRRIEREFPPRPTVAVTEDAIKKAEPHNALEGIWTDTEDKYRLGIVPATDGGSDYVAVVLSSNTPIWHAGEIKAEIRTTASPDVFTCTFFMGNKKPLGTTLTLEHNALLRSPPVNIGSASFSINLVRVWPKVTESTPNGTETKIVESGTGFLLTHNGLVATNWHVVEDAKNISVAFPGWNKPVSAEIVVKDKVNDLVILRISDTNALDKTCRDLPFQVASSSSLTLGQQVSTVGYPLTPMLGSNPKFAEGVVSSKSGLQDDPRWLQISAQVQPGSSGSPLFDSQGDIVGVVVARLNDSKVFQVAAVIPQNVNFAIKSDYLLSLLSMIPDDARSARTTPFSPEKASQCVAIVRAW